MKKIIYLILSIIMCVSAICLISACDKETKEDTVTTNSAITAAGVSASTTISNLTQTIINNEEDAGGGVITVQKYRHKFYSIPGPFVDLVERDAFFAWRETINMTSTAETIAITQFIDHFGISREQFDKANLELARRIQDKLYGKPCINPKDYANQEDDEVFNADIIFTFDDDLIREYYLSPDYPYLYDIEFEQAVENGEYISRTEDWVDIAQMEADIIAKYGEAEIVTEAETTAEGETESAEATEITEAPEEITQTPSETQNNITA